MARVAETIPELWLNQQGFFTMRGLKTWKGQGELDLVGYHPHERVGVHVEVSASPKPAGFLGGESAARIRKGVAAYVRKKYRRENVEAVREATCPAEIWRLMLAHGELKREEEVREALRDNDVEPVSLFDMLAELSSGDFTILTGLSSGNLPYRVDTDAAYFAYLAQAYAKRTGGRPQERG